MKAVGIFLFIFITVPLIGQISDTLDIPVIDFNYRLPYNPLYQDQVQVYDSTRLSSYTGRTLSELLCQESHTIVKSYGPSSLATVSFRGKSASHTGVYWNGIRINSPLVGQVDMNTLPVNAISKLSIYSGNSSLHTGSGALGGAISIENSLNGLCSDCLDGKKIRYSGIYKTGSFGLQSTMFDFQQAIGRVNIGIGAYYDSATNNFPYLNTARREPRIDSLKNAAYEQWGINGNIQYIPRRDVHSRIKDSLNIAIWYQSYDRQVPPLMPDLGVERDENQIDKSLRISAQYLLQNGNYRHEITAGISSENILYSLYFLVPNQKPYEQFYASSDFSSLQLNYSISRVFNFRHHLQLSTFNTYDLASYTERRMTTEFNASRFTNQLQASYLYKMTRELHGEVQGNISSYFPGGVQLNGSAGIFYRLSANENTAWVLGAEIGRNSHQPTLNDLYWEPGGNPNLKPEKGLELSIPVSWQHLYGNSVFKVGGSAYYSLVKDWILWKPSRYQYWNPENIRTVMSSGIEISAEWIFKGDKFHSELRNNYSFSPTLDKTFDESLNIAHYQLPYIPLHQYQLSYGIFLPLPQIGLSYTLRVNGARYIDMPFARRREILDHYSIHDVQVSYELRFQDLRPRFLFRVENLWNTDYQSIRWRPMPGRNYTFLIHLNFTK